MNILGLPAYSDHEAYTNLIEALKVAESAALQLATYRSQPAWLKVRLGLEGTREVVTQLALNGALKRG